MQLEIKSRDELNVLIESLSTSVSAARFCFSLVPPQDATLLNELRLQEDILRRCEDLFENFKEEK